ncbi:MAG: hypothetical protein ACLQHF_16855 [Terracidiphilus sp.]
MRRALPTFLLLLTLPSPFSIAQGAKRLSPFDRYLSDIRAGRTEAALVRIAELCGVNPRALDIRYAIRPGEVWKLVKGLSHAIDDQETDFFATAEVWHTNQKVLVEEWSMDSEAGDETRRFFCLADRQVIYGEQIDWSAPQEEEEGNPAVPGWAYEVRWKVEQGKFFKSILEHFVNEQERPIRKPELGPNGPTVFGLIPEIKTWNDLKLPDAMLQ